MKLISMKSVVSVSAWLVALLPFCGVSSQGQATLFEDNFDTDNGSWDVFGGSTSGFEDHTAEFGFDYSTARFTLNGESLTVPSAPNANGTTRGLKLTVNKDGTPELAAVSVYPRERSFSGDYALRFDLFLSYTGGAGGATGSTEYALFGLNHLGTQVNWENSAGSDGIFFGVDGEAGSGVPGDYLSYQGEAGFAPLREEEQSGGFIDRNGDGRYDDEYPEDNISAANSEFGLLFPTPPFESTGAPGKRWVQVEVRQKGGVVSWLIDGYVIAERTPTIAASSGNIMLGLQDLFTSVPNPADETYALFDNLRVVDLTESADRPRITVATKTVAAEPGTSGAFTVSRSGSTEQAVVVSLKVGGTATSGVDYEAIPATVTIPAGAEAVDVPVTVINDNQGEQLESVTLQVVANGWDYEVYAPMVASMEITDDNDIITVTVQRAANAFERFPNKPGSFRFTRVGDASADLQVNFTVGGSAQAGTDYEALPANIVIPGGETSVLLNVVPVNNSTANPAREVSVTAVAGSGYVVGDPASATVMVVDDEFQPGPVVYSDNFDTDTTDQWTVLPAHGDASSAVFNYNYGDIGIPSAPNTAGGTTSGLRVETNNGLEGIFTGISVSPLNQGFEGDYRLLFDMWANYPGPLETGGTGSTLSSVAGIGTTGDVPQFIATSVQGVLFSVTGDGGSSIDWRAYTAAGAPLTPATGAYAAGTQDAARNAGDPYYSMFGGVTAPDAMVSLFPEQTGTTPVGAPGMAWHEVAITKIGTNVTWHVDGVLIATVDLTGKEISTNIFLGMSDINGGQTDNFPMAFTIFDNVRVQNLNEATPRSVEITGISRSGNNVMITFQGNPANQTYTVLGSTTVDGTYSPEAGVTIETVGNGQEQTMRATVPMTTASRFFVVRAQ